MEVKNYMNMLKFLFKTFKAIYFAYEIKWKCLNCTRNFRIF